MNDPMYCQIVEKVGAIARGEVSSEHLTGSTTVRLAVGLIVGNVPATNPNFPGNDDDLSAWEMLDSVQRAAVRDMNPAFREPYGSAESFSLDAADIGSRSGRRLSEGHLSGDTRGMMQFAPNESDAAVAALKRLVSIASGDTGQSRRVADFILAWWNAGTFGGFDFTHFWNVDLDIGDDMMVVIGLIRRTKGYPDKIVPREHIMKIVAEWRNMAISHETGVL